MSDLVSVILPTHNRSKLLLKAVESILQQTHPHIEIVIVVDACTDSTMLDLNKYKHNAQFKIIVSKSNLGGAEARNVGIRNASGEFLAFLDDDDTWIADKVSKQLVVFHDRDDVCLVGCNYYHVRRSKKLFQTNIPENITLEDMLYKNVLGSFSFCMTRMKFVEGLNISKSLKASQDWELWLKILLKTNLNIVVLRENLVYYNRSTDHTRLTTSFDQAITSYKRCVESFWEHMNKSQRNYHNAIILNRKSYVSQPNSIRNYLISIKYIVITINRFKLRELLGLFLRFWINQCLLLKKKYIFDS